MIQFFLQGQAAQTVQKSTEIILNYGAVGAILVLALIAIYAMARSFSKQNSETNSRMNRYIDEDRKQMIDVIGQNTVAFTKMIGTIDDLRDEIHELKKLK